MTNKQTILSIALGAVLATTAYSQSGELSRQPLGDKHSLIRLDKTKRYLLLPMQDSAPEAHLRFVSGNKELSSISARLAQTKVEYMMPVDLTEIGDITALYALGVPDSAVVWSQLQQSDSYTIAPDPYRPSYHFAPQLGWMNDPNGMFYLDGVYHLYYQANPYGSTWGNLSWGHATSRDLVRWDQQPTALFPDVHGMIFSGSAVVDKDNTSGFGHNAVVAFYTSARERQTQSLAYSTDGGRSFTKYEGNPVLAMPYADFRDPKVIWHTPSKRWVMILAVGQEMQFYTSTNLKEWSYASSFGAGYGAHGGVWECPDLIELPVKGTEERRWVLICNLNPGGPNGGSAMQYFVGDFDGKSFTTKTPGSTTKWVDYGKDHYATVSWHNAPGAPTVIGWMSNWEYATQTPSKQFRSAMTLPRTLGLYLGEDGEHYLSMQPVSSVETLRGKGRSYGSSSLSAKGKSYQLPADGRYELLVEVESGKAKELSLKLGNAKGEYFDIRLDLSKGQMACDRSKSGIVGFSDKFPSVAYSPLPKSNRHKLRIFVDNASVEVFDAEGGRYCQTNIVFPTKPLSTLTVSSTGQGARLGSLAVYPLSVQSNNKN